MKVIFQNSELIFKKSVNLVGLFTTQVCTTLNYPLNNNVGRFWAPSNEANELAVGKYVYGIECLVGVAGTSFDVCLCDFASPAGETYTDDLNASLTKVATFTTTKSTGTERFLFDSPIFIPNINKRIGVEELNCFGWNGAQYYKYVVGYRVNNGTPQTIKYPYCDKLFFNLLVKNEE